MKAKRKRPIKDGAAYAKLFALPSFKDRLIDKDADIRETLKFIDQTVKDEVSEAIPLAKFLNHPNEYQFAKRLWDFVYWHIQYEYDEERKEQIRSYLRVWSDRIRGVDCDDYTKFNSCIMHALKIPHFYRITKYWDENGNVSESFQHIYPVMLTKNGQEVIIDDVMEAFDEEAPYAEKMDYYPSFFKSDYEVYMSKRYKTYKAVAGIEMSDFKIQNNNNKEITHINTQNMELEYLSGYESNSQQQNENIYKRFGKNLSVDQIDLMGIDDLINMEPSKNQLDGYKDEDFGKLNLKDKFKNIGKNITKVVHQVNIINPATLLLRLGVLASMKLNIMGVASKLRYAYMDDQQAQSKGIIADRFQKLKNILAKLEDIFFAAGGQKESLKKAILEGNGNKDKEVQGLGYIDDYTNQEDLSKPYNERMNLKELLSGLSDEFYVNTLETQQQLMGLGEPATATAIAAASSAIALIAGLIKQIGSLKGDNTEPPSNPNEITPQGSSFDRSTLPPILPNPISQNNSLLPNSQSDSNIVNALSINNTNASPPSNTNSEDSMFAKIKNWVLENPILSAGIGVGVLTAGVLVYTSVKKKKKDNKSRQISGFSGTNYYPAKKQTKKKAKPKSKPKRKARKKANKKYIPIAIM